MFSSKDTGGTFCTMKNLMFLDKILFLYPPNILLKHTVLCLYIKVFTQRVNEAYLKEIKSLDSISAALWLKFLSFCLYS